MDFPKLQQEMQQARLVSSQFGMGEFCTYAYVSLPNRNRLCHVCLQDSADVNTSESIASTDLPPGSGFLQTSDLAVQGPSEGSDVPWAGVDRAEFSDGLCSGPGCEKSSVLDVLYSTDPPAAGLSECERAAQESVAQNQFQHEACEQLLELLMHCSMAKGKPRNMVETNQGK